MSYCSDITKNRILECAKDEFLNKGFEKAQVAEIAKAANELRGQFTGTLRIRKNYFIPLLKRYMNIPWR